MEKIPNEGFLVELKMLPPHLADQRLRVLNVTWKQAPDDRSIARRMRILTVHHCLGSRWLL
jgi:hypothetical protein